MRNILHEKVLKVVGSASAENCATIHKSTWKMANLTTLFLDLVLSEKINVKL
jgi:hypothetical protein